MGEQTLARCRTCQAEVDRAAQACPKCGRSSPARSRAGTSIVKIGAVIGFLVIVWLVLSALS
jgi:predicted amidophosphoribosyltransferase